VAEAALDVADARAEESLEATPVPAETVELTPGTMGALIVGTGATGVGMADDKISIVHWHTCRCG
jgi:hypothetical protein